MNLVYRETRVSDVEDLFSVRARTRESPFTKAQLAAIGITPESVAEQLGSGRMRGWVCVPEARVVGFCNGDAETGEVLVLAVLPEYEGKGIGSGLLSRVVEALRSLGFQRLWLAASSDPNVRAHGFYRSQGWRPCGQKQGNGDEILECLTQPLGPTA